MKNGECFPQLASRSASNRICLPVISCQPHSYTVVFETVALSIVTAALYLLWTLHTAQFITSTTTTTTVVLLRPLYRTTCISRHLQLRTGGFCWSTFAAGMPLLTATSALRLGGKMLEFSSVVLHAPSPYYYTPFTRYNQLSNRLYNGFDNQLYSVDKHPC